jgi:hypothetical protein
MAIEEMIIYSIIMSTSAMAIYVIAKNSRKK